MTFCYFSIYCLFYPIYWVYNFVAPFLLHHIDSPLKFSIYDPNKQKSLFLECRNRYLLYSLICKTWILNCNSSWRLRRWKSPRRIHHNDIKFSLSHLSLPLYQLIKIKSGHICTNRNSIITHIRFCFYIKSILLVISFYSLR